jgi:hypothetical protein
MSKAKSTIADKNEALAEALGLSPAEAKEWQMHYALLKRLVKVSVHRFPTAA